MNREKNLMAKAKETKVKNLRLRRRIRKTVGALFMASAVAVAAIPVQDIEAEDLKANEVTVSRPNAQYKVGADVAFIHSDKLDPSGKTTFTSYSVRKLSDDSYSLNWQFNYYIATIDGNQRAIISKYNDLYQEEEVLLGNSANKGYYMVEETKLDAFYTTGAGYKTVTLTYDAIKKAELGQPNEDVSWFQTYAKDNYDKYKAACDAYDEYLAKKDKWEKDKANFDKDSTKYPDPGPAPTEVVKPIDITFDTSKDFTNEQKLSYYCELASNLGQSDPDYLPGVGYRLYPVTDNINPSQNPDGTAKKIYLAYGGTPINVQASNDENGFLVTEKSTEIIGIADGAFAGIKNVNTLDIPKEIKYVGDEAFKESFIKKIVFANVANVGNHAFEGCSELREVSLSNTSEIGVEAFKNSGIEQITLPYSISEIHDGAFAECHNLRTVDLSNIQASCVIDQYAFYNDYALDAVEMENTGITAIGEGAFAISNVQSGNWQNVALPQKITGESGKSELGNFLFAGRNGLKTVKFPSSFGINGIVNIPSGTFRNCTGLECVDFTAGAGSTVCGNVGFDSDSSGDKFTYQYLFLDVLNPNFYVMGPEKNMSGKEAFPRQSTWQSFTGVSNFVPYVYIDSNGVKCYEVSDGVYLLQANEKNELTSCRPIDKNAKDPIDLVIPAKVGSYEIKTIANGALSDSNLRDRIRSIEIQDNSLTRLDDSVFAGLPKLEKVEIGNSVNSIGNNTFFNCPNLVDITFHTPSVGYDGFTIGDNAFKTGSDELTIHGDIVPGYAPFEFAMGKDTGKIDDAGKRICYKSLGPDFLTVMYDNATEDVVLLDYPKFNELDSRNQDHLREMEDYYYAKYGGIQGTYTTDSVTSNQKYDENGAYDSDRKEFTKLWIDSNGDESVYESSFYGPWIDDAYLQLLDQGCFDPTASLPTTRPKKYFEKNPYSILKNYDRGSTATMEYQTVTEEEMQWINSCLNIVVPAGVTSIDATSFFNESKNTRNVATYFGSDDEGYESYKMCTQSKDDSVPGLFSGYYQDYDDPDSEDAKKYETAKKGNDRILSVVMSDVKKLPDYAFDSCERLQNVVLGSACTDIGTAPFRGCDSLTDITGNDYFAAENRIVYSVNEDGTYTIEECLPSRGKTGSSPIVASSTDPIISNVSEIKDGAFEDCDDVVKVYLDDAKNLKIIPENCFNDCDMLNEVGLPDSVNRIDTKAFGGNTGIEVTIPGKEVHIVSDAFEHVSTNTINTYKGTSADDYGQYYNINVEYLSDLYTVKFLDYDGTLLKEVKDVEAGKSAEPPADPTRTGYTFAGWMPKDGYNNVTSNVTLIAQYSDNSGSSNRHTVTFYAYDGKTVISTQYVDHEGAATAPMPPARSGYKFVAWVPDNFSKVTQDMSIVASYEKGDSENNGGGSGSGSKSSASPSPTASPGAGDSTKKYTVSVSGGSGSGSYAAGAVVAINAYFMGDGQTFDKWTTSTAGVGFANASASSTTFTMPAANVAITATYKAGKGTAATGSGGSGSNGGSSNSSNGAANTGNNSGTVVEITKPGVSNTGLAGATVTGATDNFVVKITEDQSATDAVTAALQAEYGDISRIQYFPMDISLYDSTGRTKIADTTGISVNITMPIPDELVQYAGNNKAGAVANGSLEGLGVKFTTVNGVPCINFTATHFSPYTIYVNTADLTASGTIDATPKTGDPIHPKWFLAIGMACISLVLFFKKDRVYIKKAG